MSNTIIYNVIKLTPVTCGERYKVSALCGERRVMWVSAVFGDAMGAMSVW